MEAEQQDFLRPNSLEEYIGQASLKEHLLTRTTSALLRGKRLPHTLLIAPPGYGKTSIASLIAKEAAKPFISFVMPIAATLLERLMEQYDGIVLFDELHRLSSSQQEKLLSIIDENESYLQLPDGRRIVNNDITIIGATTEPDQVIGTLHDRFDVPSFDTYSQDEMVAIVLGMAAKLDTTMEPDTAKGLASAAAGNPRAAGRLVTMARDLEVTVGAAPEAKHVLEACRITPTGLTENHLRYLRVLDEMGGTAGLSLISNHLRLPSDMLLQLERLLINQKLVTYTGRGRKLTRAGVHNVRKDSDFGF